MIKFIRKDKEVFLILVLLTTAALAGASLLANKVINNNPISNAGAVRDNVMVPKQVVVNFLEAVGERSFEKIEPYFASKLEQFYHWTDPDLKQVEESYLWAWNFSQDIDQTIIKIEEEAPYTFLVKLNTGFWISPDTPFQNREKTIKILLNEELKIRRIFYPGVKQVYIARTDDWKKKYSYVGSFKNNKALAIKDSKYGYVNKEGVEILPVKFDFVLQLNSGQYIVEKSGSKGLLNSRGNTILPFQFDIINPIQDKYLLTGINKHYTVHNMEGKIITPGSFDIIRKITVNSISDSWQLWDEANALSKNIGKYPTGTEVHQLLYRKDGNGMSYIRVFVQGKIGYVGKYEFPDVSAFDLGK